MTNTAIIVTGSRRLKSYEPVFAALTGEPGDALIIHGDAAGADAMAARFARALGLRELAMPAQWIRGIDNATVRRQLNRQTEESRNHSMLLVGAELRRCGWTVLVHAFLCARSRDAIHMASKAEAAGFTVTRHPVSEDQCR